MYVTRRLSEYRQNPSELTLPQGPRSGVLVIQDEESQPKCCFGFCYDSGLRGLPFPQNTKLTVTFETGGADSRTVLLDRVLFIPVLDQPLSSNLYYVIRGREEHTETGEAGVSAKEEDRVPCCFCVSHVPNATPRTLDPSKKYHQFEIHQTQYSRHYYFATPIAPDGVQPKSPREKCWTVRYSTSEDFGLRDDAKGLDTKLRLDHPEPNTSIVIGKWYVPFMFIKDGDIKDPMTRSTYYNMTLEQRWEEVFSHENVCKEDREVIVDVDVEAEVVKLEGREIARETKRVDPSEDVWFTATGEDGRPKKVGLGSVVVERMKWEEERFGWRSQYDNRVRVKRVEKFEGGGHWKSCRCYVLVESFVLRRKNRSLVLTYDFRHADKLRSKWD